ncbi:MAG: hypothetical protein VKL39_16595 [Leptolyngbyaceae bacterium]|nr:hypothetical protein [Leptolyngbyaceae bacterium]
MVPDSRLLKAVETLGYRVTVGDVATQAGLDIRLAEQELLALASEANGHLQVAESGDIVYRFPKNVRAILRNNSLKLRLQELGQRIWSGLFYLIRIAFGVVLIASIVVVAIAVFLLWKAAQGQQEGNSRGRDSYGSGGFPAIHVFPFSLHDIFVLDYYGRRRREWSPQRRSPVGRSPRTSGSQPKLNFLEAVFSFIFGDGNPNEDLGDRRWRMIAGVIRNHGGAVTAEQIAPYLDLPPVDQRSDSVDLEDYMLPVLQRFKGSPQVSPSGGLIYHFPALQVMAEQNGSQPVPDYLKESLWPFSVASPTQRTWAIGLGIVNLAVVIAFESLFSYESFARLSEAGQLIVGAVEAGFWVFLGYAIAFLLIPLLRHLWLRRTNHKIEQRNHHRFEWANQLDQPSTDIQEKLAYARRFSAETIVSAEDLAYTTEMDLMTQELLSAEAIDQDWRERLEKRL